MFVFYAAVPASRIPSMAITKIVEKTVPIAKATLSFKKEKPRAFLNTHA